MLHLSEEILIGDAPDPITGPVSAQCLVAPSATGRWNHPAWSPDGSKLIALDATGPAGGLYVFDAVCGGGLSTLVYLGAVGEFPGFPWWGDVNLEIDTDGDGTPDSSDPDDDNDGVPDDQDDFPLIAGLSSDVIRTIAGSGPNGLGPVGGYSGDGGAATAAQINAPEHIAFVTTARGVLQPGDLLISEFYTRISDFAVVPYG